MESNQRFPNRIRRDDTQKLLRKTRRISTLIVPYLVEDEPRISQVSSLVGSLVNWLHKTFFLQFRVLAMRYVRLSPII